MSFPLPLRRAFPALFLLLCTLLACAGVQASTPPRDVAEVARGAIDSGIAVSGDFQFTVRGVGRDRKYLYLNSEPDYRSPTCLTIVVRRGLWSKLNALAGGDAEQLVGQTVRVSGKVARKKIYFAPKAGDHIRRYYYQAHLPLARIDNLEVVPAS